MLDEVFACKQIAPPYTDDNVDIRLKSFEGKVSYEPYQLPDRIVKSLLLFRESLGLDYVAVDIIRSINGDYYFLDSNPSGQWLWIEVESGHDITGAVASSIKRKWQESCANNRIHTDKFPLRSNFPGDAGR